MQEILGKTKKFKVEGNRNFEHLESFSVSNQLNFVPENASSPFFYLTGLELKIFSHPLNVL